MKDKFDTVKTTKIGLEKAFHNQNADKKVPINCLMKAITCNGNDPLWIASHLKKLSRRKSCM